MWLSACIALWGIAQDQKIGVLFTIHNSSKICTIYLASCETSHSLGCYFMPKAKSQFYPFLTGQRTIQPSQWRQESSGLFVSFIPGAQEQGGPPWTQQTVTTCLAFPGVKSLHSPGDGQRAAPGALPCTPSSPVRRGRGSQLQDPAVLAPYTFSFITHHL